MMLSGCTVENAVMTGIGHPDYPYQSDFRCRKSARGIFQIDAGYRPQHIMLWPTYTQRRDQNLVLRHGFPIPGRSRRRERSGGTRLSMARRRGSSYLCANTSCWTHLLILDSDTMDLHFRETTPAWSLQMTRADAVPTADEIVRTRSDLASSRSILDPQATATERTGNRMNPAPSASNCCACDWAVSLDDEMKLHLGWISDKGTR